MVHTIEIHSCNSSCYSQSAIWQVNSPFSNAGQCFLDIWHVLLSFLHVSCLLLTVQLTDCVRVFRRACGSKVATSGNLSDSEVINPLIFGIKCLMHDDYTINSCVTFQICQKSMFEFHKVQQRRASGAVGKFACFLSRI